ncbi:unnamed protein product [Amaranthus hypochondriacus]
MSCYTNPNFSNPQFYSRPLLPPPPPLPIPPFHIQPRIPLPDLSNSLSSLKTLLQSSNSTLQYLSSQFPQLSISSSDLIQCPSNPNHWIPPNSLFSHSLNCPFSLDLDIFLDSLQYPKTLNSEQHPIHQNKFVQPLNDPSLELCFSLDDYVDCGSNFFYQGCPGVVSSLNDDASRKIFTLPGILLVECANFVVNFERENDGFLEFNVKMLPSEIWRVRHEVELWNDHPNEYSYNVVKAFLCMGCVNDCDLLTWLISNSSRFGVVIDVSMRDHMSVLFRLCLKAMVREAAHSHQSVFESEMDDNGPKLDRKASIFKCPVTVEALRWLVSQLAILYGQVNAKSLVLAMLRQLLYDAASNASFFPLHKKLEQTSATEQETSGEATKNERNDRTDKRIFSNSVFVYQIAAAIAALHERSLLEERIRTLKNPVPLTAYQRMVQYQDISKKADAERLKRPDYRPLHEHDSLPSQRQHNQDTNKLKTREELLAEERDYKRRRMSYRGKKLKRTTKEVMRDIIEDYMEAIKQTGGIGALAKGDAEGAMTTFRNSTAFSSTNLETKHHFQNNQHAGDRKFIDNDYYLVEKTPVDASPCRKGKESYDSGDLEKQRTDRNRCSRDYHSRSPSRDRRHNQSREYKRHKRNHCVSEKDEDERSKSKYSFPTDSGCYDKISLCSASSSLRNHSGKHKRKLESSETHRRERHENDESDLFRRDGFSDRYDPSEAN